MGGAVLAVGILALAACSSASSSSSSPASGASSSGAASGSASPSGSASVAAAQSAVQAATAIPNSIPVTQPLPAAPPKGKTVLFLQCEQAECGEEGQGLAAAAAKIGWTVKTLNFQAANPATLVTALRTGLQYHPVAAFFSGVPQEAWQSMQKPYAAIGAVLVDNFNDVAPTGAGVLAGRGYAAENGPMGTVLADEQVADSGGAPASSLLVSVPSYPVFVPLAAAYKAEIAKRCPGCQVTEVDATLPQLLGGQLIPAVVSAAKRVSNLKYIVSVNGQFTGQLPQALQAAGLGGKFKIISGSGVSADQQNVLNGTQLATVSSPLVMGGWQDMDEAIRWAMHLPIPAGDNTVPWVLLTKANIGTPENSWERPADYAQQFEKLWHVG
jgi:ribose transport system substrate-binding protein